MSTKPPCLINQDACGRVEGNPVCPKCGLDDRVVYPGGQGDLEVALTIATAKYWQTHAQQLNDDAKTLAKAKEEAESKAREQEQALASALQQAETQAAKRAEMIQIMLAAEAAAQANRAQDAEREKQKAQTTLMVEVIVCLVVGAGGGWWWSKQQAPHQATVALAADAAPAAEAATSRQAWEPQMVVIPSGSFTMGSSAREQQLVQQSGASKEYTDRENPQRTVNIRRFELGKYEVTQGQWKAVMGSNPSSFSNCGDTCPVENVSWNDIQQFIQKLNQKTGKTYRLPSESEWEYAARAGCQSAFNVADQCKEKIEPDEANFDGNYSYNGSAKGVYREKPIKVGSFAPNSFGLYDMHGNVWEWLQDCYEGDYRQGQPTNGSAHRGQDSSCSRRVLRGGSWYVSPQFLRSAIRNWYSPVDRLSNYGFRLARTVP